MLLVETSSAPVQEVLDTSFEILRSYSLLLWRDEQSSHSMHKLVHAWSFERSKTTSKAQFCKAALKFLASHIDLILELPHRLTRMIPHMMMCFARACELYAQICDADKAGIVDSLKILTEFFRFSSKSSLAYEVSSFVNERYQQNRCVDQYPYYENVGDLGRLMMLVQGNYKEAIELLQPALAQCREVHSPGHEHAINIAETLSCALNHERKDAEAETVLIWALGACKAPHDTLRISKHLACLLSREKRISRAKSAGFRQPGETTWAHEFDNASRDYAEVLHKIGQYETSDALLKKAWKDSNKVLGPQHRCTLQILERRGFMFYLLGNLKEADRLLSQALSGFKKTSGLDQLDDTMICMSLNAKCKEAQGLYDEAIECHQNASDGFARILDFDHPIPSITSPE